MTNHAKNNLIRYSELIEAKKIKMLVAGIKSASRLNGSTSVVVELDQAIANPFRNDWQANDIICAIVRNRQVVTVMLTRKSQCNLGHFRTDRIARVH